MEKLKVTGWTDWDSKDYESFPDRLSKEAYEAVVKEVKEKGYKFSGPTHQYHPKGTPILNNKYKYDVSCRMWGDVMAEAYDLRESEDDAYAYVLWAWSPKVIGEKDGKYIFEEEILPR